MGSSLLGLCQFMFSIIHQIEKGGGFAWVHFPQEILKPDVFCLGLGGVQGLAWVLLPARTASRRVPAPPKPSARQMWWRTVALEEGKSKQQLPVQPCHRSDELHGELGQVTEEENNSLCLYRLFS